MDLDVHDWTLITGREGRSGSFPLRCTLPNIRSANRHAHAHICAVGRVGVYARARVDSTRSSSAEKFVSDESVPAASLWSGSIRLDSFSKVCVKRLVPFDIPDGPRLTRTSVERCLISLW